jgi:hypothetical protein
MVTTSSFSCQNIQSASFLVRSLATIQYMIFYCHVLVSREIIYHHLRDHDSLSRPPYLGTTAPHHSSMSSTRKTRLVLLSDTHNQTPSLPRGDILIHAGDLTNQGSYAELVKAVGWLERVGREAGFEAVVVVAGACFHMYDLGG